MDDARVLAVLAAALEHPAHERDAFLAGECGGDERLVQAVRTLLRAHEQSAGFLESPAAASSAPATIGPYRLLHGIGAGGMGQVWLAERDDGAFRQKVAIKVLASALGDPEAVRRAEAERQFLAWLNHPNIAHVIDGGTTAEGQPYVVMEYVEGLRIDQWCSARRLDLRGRVTLFLQVLDALDAAHRALIIHRDIKPSNVMVTNDGRVKLLDFGIAKSLAETRVASRTATGLAALTPQYASPEQLAGQPLTTASDIYSLGLLLYELLSGQAARPSGAYSLRDLAGLLSAPPPTRPSQRIDAAVLGLARRGAAEWQRRLAGDLDRIVLKSLASEPERRYASARAFADDLQRWLQQRPVSARGDGWAYRVGKFLGRNRVLAAVVALAIVGILGGLAAALVQARRAAQEAERARQVSRFMLDIVGLADPFVSGGTPTLEQAINRAAATLGERFRGQPELEGDIRYSLGRAYLSLNRLDAAQWQLERSVALREGGDAVELAEARDSLATVEWSYGRYENSESLFRQALAGLGRSARERAAAVVIHNDYSALLNELGRYAEAQSQLQQALKAVDAGTTVGTGDHGSLLGNLGYALHGLQRLEEASIAYSRSATLLAQADASAPDRAINLNNHALVLYDLGLRDKALALQEESLELRRKAFPGGHPMVVQSLANIANQYVAAGRPDDARRAVNEAVDLAPLHFPPGNAMLGHVYRNGARALLDLGEPERALAVAERAKEVYDGAESVQEEDRRKVQEVIAAARAAVVDKPMPKAGSKRPR